MSRQHVFLDRVISWVGLPGLALFLAAVPAIGQTSNSEYSLLEGAGFVCDSADSSACPAVVKSADGASYEMSGAGTLAPERRLVTVAGTYTHKSTDGVVLETGVWVANELVSFDFYGLAPGALMREGRALGPQQFGPMRMRTFSGPMPRWSSCLPHPPDSRVGGRGERNAASELCSRQGAGRTSNGRNKAGI